MLPPATSHRTLIEPEDLLRLTAHPQNGDGPLLVDIRPRRAYRRSHIPSSHNIPHGLLISGEPPERDLILVGEHDGDSAAAIETLHAEGFNRRILHLRGGFPTWQQQDLPLNEAALLPRLPALEPIPWFPVIGGALVLLSLQLSSAALFLLGLALATVPGVLQPGAGRAARLQR
jgi:rhodanese-related sulfurtransferase